MLTEAINRIRSNIRRYTFIWISILVSAVFVYLPFFDTNNLAAWVNTMSTLTNSSPAFHYSSWPGGPFFLSIFLPIGYFYILTGYSLYHTAILLKIILFAFTFVTGYLSYRIVEKTNPKYSRFTFLFIMINPATIYVNYIWTQLDIIPISFTLLSFYAIYFSNFEEKKFMIQLLFLIPLFIAIFTYYYPALLIPSFIIYTKGWKTSFRRFVSFAILGVIFILTDLFLFGAFTLSTVNSLAPSAATKYFQGLQSVVILPEQIFILIILFISITVPLVTKKLRISVYVPIFIILLSLLYVSNISIPDNFLWILPFSILAILSLDELKMKRTFAVLSNIFLFTGILFINFYIGTGTQAGIFYFGYRVFHYNYLFIRSLSAFHLYVEIYFIFLTFSFIFSIFIVLFFNLRYAKVNEDEVKTQIKSKNSIYKERKIAKGSFHAMKNIRSAYLKRIVLVFIFVLILIAGSFVFNSTAFSEIDYNGSNTVPIYYFAPSYNNGIFAMPINNVTYKVDGSSVVFYNQSSSICLSRNIQNELIDLSMKEQISGNCIENVSLVKSSLFNVNLYRSLEINNSFESGIMPVNTINVSSKNISINNVTNPIEVYNVSRGNLFTYKITNTTVQRSVFYDIPSPLSPSSTFNQTVPFGLKLGNFTFNVVLYKNTGLLVFHNNTQSCFVKPFSYYPISNNWNLLSYSIVRGNFNIEFDSYNYSFSLPANNNNTLEYVYIGSQPGLGKTHSFEGEVSIMYNSTKFQFDRNLEILVKGDGIEKAFNTPAPSVNISVCDNMYQTKIQVNNNSLDFNQRLTYLMFGKLDNYDYGLIISINNLIFKNMESDSYYMIPVYFAFLIPYLSTFYEIIYIKKR